MTNNVSSKDWKYLVMLAVTVAGVLAPIWFANYQNPSKKVVVRVLSQSALQPTIKEKVPGLQVLFDGTVLAEPYLSVLQIVNEGKRPVSTNDFEAPLELHVESNQNIVHARVSEKIPEDIYADVSWEKQAVQLKPTLLNPNDSITVAILSAGGTPSFVSRARINGISAVPVLGTEKNNTKPLVLAFCLVSAFLFAITSVAAYWRFSFFSAPDTYTELRPRTILAISIMLEFGMIGMMSLLFYYIRVQSFWVSVGSILLLLLIAIPFARWLEAHPANDNSL